MRTSSKILIVERDSASAHHVAEALLRLGYRIWGVYCQDTEAAQALAQSTDLPILAVLDRNLTSFSQKATALGISQLFLVDGESQLGCLKRDFDLGELHTALELQLNLREAAGVPRGGSLPPLGQLQQMLQSIQNQLSQVTTLPLPEVGLEALRQVSQQVAQASNLCQSLTRTSLPKAKVSLSMDLAILVVDDEEALRRLMAAGLRRWGYTVVEAKDGHQALDFLLERAFDLVIMDVVMPGLSGLDVLSHLNQLYPQLPVLMISGFHEQEVDLDMVEYLAKPFGLEELRQRIESLLQKAQGFCD